jgi:glycolate oxidase iron-sulfur subunit
VTIRGPLGLDADELVACVSCGLCLPHCPTYRVSGREAASPRGRITAMRAVEAGVAPIDAAFNEVIDTCVQCLGCEAACPSSVPFSRLIEDTRTALADHPTRSRRRRMVDRFVFVRVVRWPLVLRTVGWVLCIAQRLGLVPRRLRSSLPTMTAATLRYRHATDVGGSPDAWLFTGCVMDAWMRDVHLAATTLGVATGTRFARPSRGGECCGALALHSGLRDDARRLARRVMGSMPGDAPIVVDSAGCGAALKGYGALVGTEAARAFAARVVDVHEWLLHQAPLPLFDTGKRVVVQDPCHLRHVQHAHGAVRTVLGAAYGLIEIPDDGLCCGAGGAYSIQQPEISREIAARKARTIVAAAAAAGLPRDDIVIASANPGCAIQLRGAGFVVAHPVELLAAALVAVRENDASEETDPTGER